METQFQMDSSNPENGRDVADVRRRILIVEDNGDMRDFLRRVWRAMDMHISRLPMGSREWRSPIETILT